MRGDAIVIGIVLGIFGLVIFGFGTDGASRYETVGGEVQRMLDSEAQAEYEGYLLMQTVGFIMIFLGGILFVAGIIMSEKPRHQYYQQQHHGYQTPYQSPYAYQTRNVYYCPDCRNAVNFIDQYQKYYCNNCNSYPFDKPISNIPPPPRQ
jgi:hypothetical protein